jgi:hypothetical protein
MIRVVSAALLALGLGFAGGVRALEVRVTAVESMEDMRAWFLQKPVPRGTFPTVNRLELGKKVYFPVVVTGMDRSVRAPLELVGDVELIDPKGKVVSLKQCCRYSVPDRSGIVTAILGNTVALELDAGDPPGVYTIRASVTDGTSRANGVYRMRYGAGDAQPAAAPTAVPPRKEGEAAPRRPSREKDLRHCLTLPTPAEVARCAEGR